jgi:hypothetical protein
MNIVRTLILSALGAGALAFATPSQAADVIVKERTYSSGDRYYHHHHHRDWERKHRDRVILRNNDSGVSVAFGGHRHYHHDHDRNYYHRDWDHR